ncbi:LacI family transcriptional regulator [Pontibacter qinzhouensis]|uniref:LacI family transcriptional regulator n=1 Tax=Pontibacter qinzhouensis TaxID=2603253 RepID=A0A5C8KA08_9BACT|nr:LacI family DNA-binding transcriptional regulator [Pontibacter qinzhouensis]TXK47444.1 LacI family transcriptional regulator [Pontibacter qinzhouensis]
MKKQVQHTIKDVAAALGLSVSTVSRALNNHPHISQETKQRVQEVVEKLDYRHNALAASLRNSRSNMIGLIAPRITMYFQSTVITAIQNKLHEYGYNLMVCQSNDLPAIEKELVKVMYASRVEGLIVSSTLYTEDFSHFDIFNRANIPLVFYDRVPREYPAHKIQGDDYQGGYQTTRHLLEQGARQIAYITGPLSCKLYSDRYEGYKKALREFEVEPNDNLIFCHELNKENALQTCELLFADGTFPEAVFAGNDTTAVAVVQYAKERGIAVPAQLKVTGYSNDSRTEIIEPPITSVEQFPYEVGVQAATLMMELLEQNSKPGQNYISLTTPIELVKRQSSGL